MILLIILWVIFAIVSEFLTYKYIKKLDKKERIKLNKWETAYVERLTLLKNGESNDVDSNNLDTTSNR